jgi:hypothetical protein
MVDAFTNYLLMDSKTGFWNIGDDDDSKSEGSLPSHVIVLVERM